MSTITILFLGIGLSMDAFAVSVCKGLALKQTSWKDMLIAGLWFGCFQGLMPCIGYFLGSLFAGYIDSFSSWIAFLLLALIGGNMIREACFGEEEDVKEAMNPSEMFLLAIATSIDALAVGLTFSVVPVDMVSAWPVWCNTLLACGVIMLETGILSAIGVKIGSLFGNRFGNKAQIVGGIVLICIGLRILANYYGFF